MGWTDIHSFDRDTYCFALALYKIQFKEIWYHEIEIIVEPKAKFFYGDNMVAIHITSDVSPNY
jgi:hypothetical protein